MDDGFAIQEVGRWAEEKHDYLIRYIEASSGPRSSFIPPKGTGGAAYIDLFAGPGIGRIRGSNRLIPGSPLLALQHARAPFTKVILCDIDARNIEALRHRSAPFDGRVEIIQGDSNQRIGDVVALVPRNGLNIALLDPFGLSGLTFETVSRLAAFERMDLIIHFPIGDMKRNWRDERVRFERFLGVPYAEWGVELNGPDDVRRLIPVLRKRLAAFGYDVQGKLHSPSVKNTKNVVLYVLVYASKHDTGNKIWKSITKTTPAGQKTLPIPGLD